MAEARQRIEERGQCPPESLSSLEVVATLQGPIALPGVFLALDSLLAAAVALRDGLPPKEIERHEIEVPLAREPEGRFHQASVAHYQWEKMELHWVNKRSPIKEAQDLGAASLKRILLSGGLSKNWRLPMEKGYVAGDRLVWWCLGDEEKIRGLLSLISHLGKRRAVGLGRVVRWEVSRVEPWEGFPCVRDGFPTRPLPPSWSGLRPGLERAYVRITYPYDEGERVECVVPEVGRAI